MYAATCWNAYQRWREEEEEEEKEKKTEEK